MRFARKVCLAAWKDFLLKKAMLAFFICVDSLDQDMICVYPGRISRRATNQFFAMLSIVVLTTWITFSGPKFSG